MRLSIGRRAYLEEAEEEEAEEDDDDEEDSSSLLESPFFFFFFFWGLRSTRRQSEMTRSRRQWWSPTRLHKETSDDERGKAAKRGQRDTSRKHKRGKVTRNTKGQPDICWFSLRGIVADGVDEDDLPRC